MNSKTSVYKYFETICSIHEIASLKSIEILCTRKSEIARKSFEIFCLRTIKNGKLDEQR